MEIDNDTKRKIIEQRIGLWRNTLYSNELDAKVGQQLVEAKLPDGTQILEAAKAEMKKCFSAIELLQKELDALAVEAKP